MEETANRNCLTKSYCWLFEEKIYEKTIVAGGWEQVLLASNADIEELNVDLRTAWDSASEVGNTTVTFSLPSGKLA